MDPGSDMMMFFRLIRLVVDFISSIMPIFGVILLSEIADHLKQISRKKSWKVIKHIDDGVQATAAEGS
jgi:hypothetical protein